MKKLLLFLLFSSGINAQMSITECEYNNSSGTGKFNLNALKPEILNGLSADEYTVTFYESQENANGAIEPINFPHQYFNSVAFSQTVFARATKNSNTTEYFTRSINLSVNERPNVEDIYLSFPDNYDDNPTDGFAAIPEEFILQQILPLNEGDNFEIKFFVDTALTTPAAPMPYPIYQNATVYYTVTNTITGCRGVEIVTMSIVNGTLSIDDKNLSTLKIYPNPVSNVLNIDGDFDSVSIVNSLGQTVVNSNEKQIDLSSFSAGVYFAYISSLSGVKTTKIIKQ